MKQLILICMLLSISKVQAKHHKLNLQKAIDQKLVKTKVLGLGGYQGYCISMDLKNLTKDSVIILVEAGRRLNSEDDKYQDILIVKEELITLRNFEEKKFKIKGYCCQASNSCPPINAKYDANKLADTNLVILARFLNAGKFNSDVEQQSIWAISDKKLTANISSLNDSLLYPLRKLVADIKGEILPWYSIISGTYVYSNGVISNFPVWLKGKLNYSSEKDDYVTLIILDTKGQQVCMTKSEWVTQGQNKDYSLNVPVKGLAKGKYTIALKNSQGELVNKSFEI